MNYNHRNVRYKCTECDLTATTKAYLKRHMLVIHQGVRYDCDQCDREFAGKSNLRTHQLNMHEGARYTCDVCQAQLHSHPTLVQQMYLKILHGMQL